MNPVEYYFAAHQTDSLPLERCQRCGATDKKLSGCAQCHFEKYCSSYCQKVAWPKHRFVCLANPKNQKLIAGSIEDYTETK